MVFWKIAEMRGRRRTAEGFVSEKESDQGTWKVFLKNFEKISQNSLFTYAKFLLSLVTHRIPQFHSKAGE